MLMRTELHYVTLNCLH